MNKSNNHSAINKVIVYIPIFLLFCAYVILKFIVYNKAESVLEKIDIIQSLFVFSAACGIIILLAFFFKEMLYNKIAIAIVVSVGMCMLLLAHCLQERLHVFYRYNEKREKIGEYYVSTYTYEFMNRRLSEKYYDDVIREKDSIPGSKSRYDLNDEYVICYHETDMKCCIKKTDDIVTVEIRERQ